MNKMNFEELVERISPRLKGIAHRLNGCYSFVDEGDLYQESLLNLWTLWQKEKLRDKTESYILEGCYFYLRNYLRKAKIPKKGWFVSLDEPIDEEGHILEEIIPDPSPLLSESIERKMIVEEIMEKNNLTEREKEILGLSAEGFTVREIGRRLNISHPRVVKIRNKIRERLSAYCS